MNRYMKLVHMEISRFWKLYVALLVATLLMQCGGVFYSVRSYISNRKQNMEIELLTDAQYAIKYGAISFYRTLMDMSFWIIAPIALRSLPCYSIRHLSGTANGWGRIHLFTGC